MHDSAIATTCWFVEFGTRPVYASSSEVGIATLGSYELDMSRTSWDATVIKKMRSWRDVLAEDRATMRTELLRFNGAVERDPAIDAWMKEHAGELGAIAHQWFEVMRKCGDEVRELLHDGHPVACLGDAPFGYVNVFTSHVNVGFFHGASLSDPARCKALASSCAMSN